MWIVIIVVLIGAPLAFIKDLQTGNPDWGQWAVGGVVFLLALGGAWNKIQKARVQEAQKRYWLNQRK